MSANDKEILEGFEDEDDFFLVKAASPNAVRNVSYYTYLNNKKSGDVEYFGEDHKMNSSFKSPSMGSRCAHKKTKVIWTAGLHKKFLGAIEKLGIDKAAPKKILELMKVDGLTRDHVASHLQKYRIITKKIADANYCVQPASKPSLLESSMTNGASWNNSSLMLNRQQMNWPSYSGMHAISQPILDTSSSCFRVLEASNFNATISSEFARSGSLPNEGYSMQVMTNNLDEQTSLIYGTTNFGFVNSVNSSNSGLAENLDGFKYDYGGFSTEVYPYDNIEIGSSSAGVPLNKELAMSWNHENPINIGNSSNSTFVENSNGFESNYSSQSENFEMSSLYGSNSNSNLENGIGEDDLILNEADIASLLSYADDNGEYGGTSNNLPFALNRPNQDVNGENLQNIVPFDSTHNEGTTSINGHQTLDRYLPGFNPTFNMHIDEQFMESMWSPEPVVDDKTLQGVIFNSYVQE